MDSEKRSNGSAPPPRPEGHAEGSADPGAANVAAEVPGGGRPLTPARAVSPPPGAASARGASNHNPHPVSPGQGNGAAGGAERGRSARAYGRAEERGEVGVNGAQRPNGKLDAPRPPTPARESRAASQPAELVPLPEEEMRLEVEGAHWCVRILGRSMGGRRAGQVPLLLLGFWTGEPEGPPHRERLVQGRTLEEVGYDRLETALHAAGPPPAPGSRAAFFEGTDEHRGR